MTRLLATALLVASVGGCDVIEPYVRPGNWRPVGANDNNLVSMVAVPSDLVRGTSDTRGNGQLADAALERLRSDKVRPLTDTSVSKVGALLGQ